ncbi:MAG: FAD-binding oxidoreductase [Bacteroidota bacterium]
MADSPSSLSKAYASWGRFPEARPAGVERLAWRTRLPDLDAFAQPVLAYGQGRSYGDSCLNNGGVLLDTDGLDRLIAFDQTTGRVRAEAGVTLAKLLDVLVPAGWFLPVTPGTKFVSLGGAIANDVHGKNHHVAGTFGRFVTAMELVRSDAAGGDHRLVLTPDGRPLGGGDPDDAVADLFRATIGGLGLTGLITWAEFQAIPIQSDQIAVTSTRFRSLPEFLTLADAAADEPYTVAWIDALSPQGRGLFMQGHHVAGSLPAPSRFRQKLAAPFDAPSGTLNALTVRAFNAVYYRAQLRDVVRSRKHYEPFFYPLDAVGDWNRIYGRRGFLQYQCVVPFSDGVSVTEALLAEISAAGAASFLAVLKTFGDVPSPGLLSFPRPGITLALDLPHRGPETLALVRRLNAIAIEAGGALYPAKDAVMTPAQFRASFPDWEAFAAHVDPQFSSSFWRRVTTAER